MTRALQAPSSVRRSKKRLAVYEQKHEQLRREVDDRKLECELEQILMDEIRRDPAFLAHGGLT